MNTTKEIKSVVITGASTGIGRACALDMDQKGWQVFAGVRKESDAAELRKLGSVSLTPVLLDVTKPASVKEAVRQVDKAAGQIGLAGLVNNAGVPYGGPVEYLELEEVRREFEVNFFGVIAVTQAFLPLLRKGGGRIINISSSSGLMSAPFISPYSASKFALEALSDSLRLELSPWKMEVCVVEPGDIETPIWNKGGDVMRALLKRAPQEGLVNYGGALGGMEGRFHPHGLPSEAVARVVAHALTSKHPRSRYQVGWDARLFQFLRNLPDRLRDRVILSQFPKWGQGQ